MLVSPIRTRICFAPFEFVVMSFRRIRSPSVVSMLGLNGWPVIPPTSDPNFCRSPTMAGPQKMRIEAGIVEEGFAPSAFQCFGGILPQPRPVL